MMNAQAAASSPVIRAVLFDFDFTLGDSSGAIVECIRFALGRLELGPLDLETAHRTVGLPLREVFVTLTGRHEPALADEFLRLFVQRADDVMVAGTSLYADTARVLDVLRACGIATAIVSTKYRRRIEGILAAASLAGVVDAIIGGDDVSRHKPDPAPLQLAMSRLGVDASGSLYVGDHPVDGQAAGSAGLRFVRVMTGADHANPAWDAIDAYATIDSIGELLDLHDLREIASSIAPTR
jgi:phosphoglycolate phosphatase